MAEQVERPKTPKRRYGRIILEIISKVMFFVAIILVWQIFVVVASVPQYLLPSPVEIGRAIYAELVLLLNLSLPTIYETVIGFLMGSAIGIGFGLLVVSSSYLRSTLYPLFVVFNSFPKVAVAPLFVVWVGLGLESKVLVSAIISFFPVFINSVTGLTEVEGDMLDLAKTMSATQVQTFIRIRFPNALPNIFDGLKIAMPLAMIGAIVGEFVGTRVPGLGSELLLAESALNTPLVFACMVFMIIWSVALFYVVVGIERYVVKWRYSARRR